MNIIDREGKKSQCEDHVLAVGDNMTPEETVRIDKKSKWEDELQSLWEKYSSEVMKVNKQLNHSSADRLQTVFFSSSDGKNAEHQPCWFSAGIWVQWDWLAVL